jgi:hypothetical protein
MARVEDKNSPAGQLAAAGVKPFSDALDNVQAGVCAWCKGPITPFRDALSQKEFGISGMCQKCQDETFS